MLEAATSHVEAIQEAGEDPDMQDGDFGGIACDEQLLALARDGRNPKPLLSDEEVQDLEDRFGAAWEALRTSAPPPRQNIGRCEVIDLAAWKLNRLGGRNGRT